jgi:hypothetical protein
MSRRSWFEAYWPFLHGLMFGETQRMILQGREFWVGTTVGALAAVLLLEPSTSAIRSVFSPDARIIKLQAQINEQQKASDARVAAIQVKLEAAKKALDEPRADLLRRAELTQDRADAEATSNAACKRAMEETQSKTLTTVASGAGGRDACVHELETISGINLRQGEATRQLGGRLYFGVESIANSETYHWCVMHGGTDQGVLPTGSPGLFYRGSDIPANTSIGKYKIHVTKAAADKQGNYCIFDIVRQR